MTIRASYSKRDLQIEGLSFFCCFGRDGVTREKVEGDWKTPLGVFPLRAMYYRPDRVTLPSTSLPVYEITKTSGWCDDPTMLEYNSFVELPFEGSHEDLWREDPLYDIIVVLGYNDTPAVPGKGSAIFLHCMKDAMTCTKGCLAIGQDELLRIVPMLSPESSVSIEE